MPAKKLETTKEHTWTYMKLYTYYLCKSYKSYNMTCRLPDLHALTFRSSVSSLTAYSTKYLCSESDIGSLVELQQQTDAKPALLSTSLRELRSLSEDAHKLAFDSVFSVIATHLQGLSEAEVCSLMAQLRVRYVFLTSYGLAWSTACGSVSSLQVGGRSTKVRLRITRRNSTALLEKGRVDL